MADDAWSSSMSRFCLLIGEGEHMRRHTSAIGVFLLMCAAPAAQSQRPVYPGAIPLPAGFGPEGIAGGNGSTFYAGAALGSMPGLLGQILVGDLRTGEFFQLVAPTGRPALGMKFDPRSTLLFVAGGPSGTGTVYDATSGAQLAFYQFGAPSPTGPPTTFINDVIVTREAAYFTDSVAPVLYRVELDPRGEPSATFDVIPLPPLAFGAPGSCGPGARANGIAATPNGNYLFVDNSSAGAVYRVDTATFTAVPIDLGGATLCNADGLLLDGKTLYVVQNANNRIAVIELSPDHVSGEITRYITEPFTSNPATQVPTTVTEFGSSLYAVTAGFAPPAPDFVVRVSK
jgi:sugar lactone lactonase YvrE